MANNAMFDELKGALMAAQPGQLNSHSTMKAAEALLGCLRRDGVMAGAQAPMSGGYGASTGGYSQPAAPEFAYKMNYVDGSQPSNAGYATGHAPSHGSYGGGGHAPAVTGYANGMPGSSWSQHY